jgi:hypothetical protein
MTESAADCPHCGARAIAEPFFVIASVTDNPIGFKNGSLYVASKCCAACHQKLVRRGKAMRFVIAFAVVSALIAIVMKLTVGREIHPLIFILPVGLLTGFATWICNEHFGLKLRDAELRAIAVSAARREFKNATPTVDVGWKLPWVRSRLQGMKGECSDLRAEWG